MPTPHLFLATLVAALWGANFVAAKWALAWFPPFFFTAMRFVLVSLLMLPFVPRPSAAQVLSIMPLALLATLHFSLVFVAMHLGMDISTSALVGQLGVPFSCLLGAIFLKDRIGIWRTTGIAVSFGGIAIVAGAPDIAAHPLAFLMALTGAFSWGIANLLVKKSDLGSQQLLAWVSLLTIPPLLLLSTLTEGNAWPLLLNPPLKAVIGIGYTAACSTIIAYGLWYWLLSRHSVSQVTPFSLLTPVFGIACGRLFFSEALGWQVIAGGIVTIAGVAIIVIRRPRLALIAEAT